MEQLQKKLEEVRQKKNELIANFNALCGAEQMLLELINENGCDVDEQNPVN